MSWRVGDKVRLYAARGGVVVADARGLKVRWPDGYVGWLDHCVPDEGPDGKIDPNSYDICLDCGNPTTGHHGEPYCVNCRARQEEETFHVAGAGAPAPPPAAIGVHYAGVMVDGIQSCARCGGVLAHPYSGRSMGYPIGALVERGNGWQAMNLSAAGPTCEEKPR